MECIPMCTDEVLVTWEDLPNVPAAFSRVIGYVEFPNDIFAIASVCRTWRCQVDECCSQLKRQISLSASEIFRYHEHVSPIGYDGLNALVRWAGAIVLRFDQAGPFNYGEQSLVTYFAQNNVASKVVGVIVDHVLDYYFREQLESILLTAQDLTYFDSWFGFDGLPPERLNSLTSLLSRNCNATCFMTSSVCFVGLVNLRFPILNRFSLKPGDFWGPRWEHFVNSFCSSLPDHLPNLNSLFIDLAFGVDATQLVSGCSRHPNLRTLVLLNQYTETRIETHTKLLGHNLGKIQCTFLTPSTVAVYLVSQNIKIDMEMPYRETLQKGALHPSLTLATCYVPERSLPAWNEGLKLRYYAGTVTELRALVEHLWHTATGFRYICKKGPVWRKLKTEFSEINCI